MENNAIIVGLDIGTTKIACVVGRRSENGKIEIFGCGTVPSIGVKRGMIANIEDTVNSIKEAVLEASEQSNVDIKSVYVGIAGQHIKSFQYYGEVIRENNETEITHSEIQKLKEDMKKLGLSPGEEIIDVMPQEYVVDNEHDLKPEGMIGSKLGAYFHIITGFAPAIKNVFKCVEKAGLHVDDLILEPVASSEAVLSDEEKEAGVVLVDIGGGTTDIAVFHDSIIRHTAVIPFGGNIITEDIRQGCNIMKKHAEEVKVKFGSALVSENSKNDVVSIPGIRGREPREISFYDLAAIIHARLTEIFDLVKFEIKKSGYENRLGGGMVITGGGALMKHIDQFASFKTGLDAKIGYSNEHLAPETPDELKSPIYATSIGLVIEGLKRYEEKIRHTSQSGGGKEINTGKTEKEPKKKKRSYFNLMEIFFGQRNEELPE
ncbi:MAG: cell division protein FtsA [Lentimicrobiaceae bacterium]|jgi:cell division protein FtsA|nr:cell division protein FtsA [Lentimicrobiaceae bacterium]